MSKICLCLSANTIAKDLEILERYRPYVDMAELRVDCLDQPERFHIRRFPEQAAIPTILTIRRKIDGGRFVEGEAARVVLLASGLAFADSDPRRNFAYVDLEEDLEVPSLEEAARAFGTRIIRSVHDFTGVPSNLAERIRALRRFGDEIAKVAVLPQGLDDVRRVFAAGRETEGIEKILLAMGPFGTCTRILAEHAGSMLSFVSPHDLEGTQIAAPGQLDPRELRDIYHFPAITKRTKVYGIVGSPLSATSSPAIHNRALKEAGLDAVYVPFRADSLTAFFSLARELDIGGISITIPFKSEFVPFLTMRSPEVEAIHACNTAIHTPMGWSGYNTDAAGFSGSLLELAGKRHLRGQKVSIIGAGGVSKAVAYEVHRLGGRACVFNRTTVRAKELAEQYRFAWAPLDEHSHEMIDRYNDIIIQTTSIGMEGDAQGDPIELYQFKGREKVMDLIYKPEKTRMLRRAEAAGCKILNGYDMLLRQAKLQFKLFTDLDFPD